MHVISARSSGPLYYCSHHWQSKEVSRFPGFEGLPRALSLGMPENRGVAVLDLVLQCCVKHCRRLVFFCALPLLMTSLLRSREASVLLLILNTILNRSPRFLLPRRGGCGFPGTSLPTSWRSFQAHPLLQNGPYDYASMLLLD